MTKWKKLKKWIIEYLKMTKSLIPENLHLVLDKMEEIEKTTKAAQKYMVIKYWGNYGSGMVIVKAQKAEQYIKTKRVEPIAQWRRFEIVAKFTSRSRLKTPIEQQFIE